MTKNIFELISIDEDSRKPKYLQIVDIIIENINNGNLKIGQKIPSINSLSAEFLLSRDTVEKAYNILKQKKITTSTKGKGVYINKNKLINKKSILLLINKLSPYKMSIYNSFIENIGVEAHIDFHIYHCDSNLFVYLLEQYYGFYDYYVIMPHFKSDKNVHVDFTPEALTAINKINKEQLVILDNNNFGSKIGSIQIFQEFDNDIYDALESGIKIISKYKRIVLSYPSSAVYPYPNKILQGFKRFCNVFKIKYEVLEKIYDDIVLKKGDLFITVPESDLVILLKEIKKNKFKIGKDIGVISYNDTPLKELLEISVLTTDFYAMGKSASDMILNGQKGSKRNPFIFKIRSSLINTN